MIARLLPEFMPVCSCFLARAGGRETWSVLGTSGSEFLFAASPFSCFLAHLNALQSPDPVFVICFGSDQKASLIRVWC